MSSTTPSHSHDPASLPDVVQHPLPAVPATRSEGSILDQQFDVTAARARLDRLREFFAAVMVEGPAQDYGVVPGTDRKTLFKAGAEKLCEFYRLIQRPQITHRVEQWDAGFFAYECEMQLISRDTGHIVGVGLGSCNSKESRYRWRQAERKCPECGATAIVRGKPEFGGGWLCFRKRGGCGAKFDAADSAVAGQEAGRVENDDVYSLVNTLLKMAKKRAVVDAVVSVTRSAGLLIDAGEDDDEDHGDDRQQQQRQAGGAQQGGGKAAAGGTTQQRQQPPAEPTISADEHRALSEACTRAGKPWNYLVDWIRETHGVDVTRARLPKRLYDDVLKHAEAPF